MRAYDPRTRAVAHDRTRPTRLLNPAPTAPNRRPGQLRLPGTLHRSPRCERNHRPGRRRDHPHSVGDHRHPPTWPRNTHHPPGHGSTRRLRRERRMGRRTRSPLLRGRTLTQPVLRAGRSPSHPMGQPPHPPGGRTRHVPHAIPRRRPLRLHAPTTARHGGPPTKTATGNRHNEPG